MNETQELLRYAFQTENRVTFAITGSGACAMEATIVNLLEPGEKVLVGCNGYWGDRLSEVARRQGVEVERLEGVWGEAIPLPPLIERIHLLKPHAVFLTHGESSTGIYQPLDGVGQACRDTGALLIVDTVVTLGGMPVLIDEWKIDAAYSGAQKCLSCPPGVSPFTFGERAMEKVRGRKKGVASFYMDVTLLEKYWLGDVRTYHHTASINSLYALRESLLLITETGLHNTWAQQAAVVKELYEGLEGLGLELLVKNPQHRLSPITTVRVPSGIDAKAVITYLLSNYNIEISGGLGQLAGQVWRIGIMGHNCRRENVLILLAALRAALLHFGYVPK